MTARAQRAVKPPPPVLGRWLIARTPTDRTYPCRCTLGQTCAKQCPCRGRTDTDKMPSHCCARRAADTARRHAA